MSRYILILIFILSAVYALNAGDVKPAALAAPDTSTVNIREDKGYYDLLTKDRAFLYREAQPSANILSLIIQRIMRWINEFLNGAVSGGYQSYIMLFLLALVIAFVILKLMGTRVNNLVLTSQKSLKSGVFLDDNIEEIDFDKLIQSSIESGNFKGAVRYSYLNALKKMVAKGLIKWAPAKTNMDYYMEINEPVVKAGFRTISLLFNYIEYGSFEVSQAIFTGAKSRFDSFYSLIGGRQ